MKYEAAVAWSLAYSARWPRFLGGYGGVRYSFKPSLSGVARVGFGASYLTLGVDYKM